MLETNGYREFSSSIISRLLGVQLTTWNWVGRTRKFKICTAGQTIKFAFSVGRYISRNLRPTARLPPPSAMVITVKKNAMPNVMY